MLKASVVVRTDAEAVIQQLEETRAALEKELKEVKEASDKAQTERQEVDSNLQSVQQTVNLSSGFLLNFVLISAFASSSKPRKLMQLPKLVSYMIFKRRSRLWKRMFLLPKEMSKHL
jgi:hypothetical protein